MGTGSTYRRSRKSSSDVNRSERGISHEEITVEIFICESVRDSCAEAAEGPGGDAEADGVGDPEGLAAEMSGTEDCSWLVPEEAVRSLGDDGGVPSYTSLDLKGVIVAGVAEKEQLPAVRLPRSECDIDLLLLEDKE